MPTRPRLHYSLHGIFVVAALLSAGIASASVVTYIDRTTWGTALAAPVFTVDFEGFSAPASFDTVPLTVGPITLSTNNGPSGGANAVIASSSPASFGNWTAYVFVDGPLTADLTFATPESGFFIDFFAAGNGTSLDLTLSLAGGGTADVLVPGTGLGVLQPFGVISTAGAITKIRFNNTVIDGFYIDNISAPTSSVATSVPEPATLGLLSLGLAGMGFARRKRKA